MDELDAFCADPLLASEEVGRPAVAPVTSVGDFNDHQDINRDDIKENEHEILKVVEEAKQVPQYSKSTN